jgi:hypothetical protein
MSDQVSLPVRLPREVHRRFRVLLAREGRSAQEVLEGMVLAWLSKKEGEVDRERV